MFIKKKEKKGVNISDFFVGLAFHMQRSRFRNTSFFNIIFVVVYEAPNWPKTLMVCE